MPSSNSPPAAAIAVVLIAVVAGGFMLASRYSPSGPASPNYEEPARRFLSAALAGDTAQLERLTGGPDVITWAVDAARTHPNRFRALLDGLEQWNSRETGDRTLALFGSKGFPACEGGSGIPMSLTFTGPPDSAKIVAAGMECDPR